MMVKGERPAKASRTLKHLGVFMRAQHVEDKSVVVRPGDWICMRKERMPDGERRPCFNHLYSHANCRHHGPERQYFGLKLDPSQAMEATGIILQANKELRERKVKEAEAQGRADPFQRNDPWSRERPRVEGSSGRDDRHRG